MSRKLDDIVPGATFGRWTVLGEYEYDAADNARVLCRCACGHEKHVLVSMLRGYDCVGTTRGCNACFRMQQAAEPAVGTTIGPWTTVAPRIGRKVLCKCACGLLKEMTWDQRRYWGQRSCRHQETTQADAARRAGISKQRVSILVARGDTIESIIAGTYKR